MQLTQQQFSDRSKFINIYVNLQFVMLQKFCTKSHHTNATRINMWKTYMRVTRQGGNYMTVHGLKPKHNPQAYLAYSFHLKFKISVIKVQVLRSTVDQYLFSDILVIIESLIDSI